MLCAERSSDGPLVSDNLMFADDADFVNGCSSERSRRVTNLVNTSVDLDAQNNDDVERIARRRSRLLEPHPEVVNSPAHDVARRAAASQSMPRAQVGEHYGNCIRLAAENKITYKNAFDLHLIDFMGEMIKKEDFTSFRMASSSLDASAKIYAGRVDAVHQETYKVLTGLGRSDSKSTKADTDGTNDMPEALGDVEGIADECYGAGIAANDKKRRERKRAPTTKPVIVTALSKIRSRIKAFDADVDPLFQHQAAAYDDGGIVELRLNRLRTHSKYSELLQDSNTPLFTPREAKEPLTCCVNPVEIYPILDSHTLEAPLCLAFDDFHFNKLEDGTQVHVAPLSPLFVCEASASGSVTPVSLTTSPMDLADDNTLPPMPSDDAEVTLVNEATVRFADRDNVHVFDAGEKDQMVEPTAEGELFVSSLKSILTTHLENFGQVNDGMLGLWAGPELWRKKAKRRRLDEFGNVAAPQENEENVTSVGRSAHSKYLKKNKKTSIDYATLVDAPENRSKSGCVVRSDWSKQLEIYTKESGKSPVLREQNRRLAGERFNLLPPSITDARYNIYELSNREVMRNLVDSKTNETQENITSSAMADGGILPPWLDSQAAAAAAEEEGRVENDMDHIMADDDDDVDDDVAPYDGIFTQGPTGSNENIATLVPLENEDGVELVAPPRQITRLEIGYARSAKLINVRHLKSVLWNMIESNLNLAPFANTSVDGSSPPIKKTRTSEEGDTNSQPPLLSSSFSDLLSALPAKVSKQTAGELSVAIGLNCLLHLANEKDLFLEAGADFTDLSISQGLSVAEMDLISRYTKLSRQADVPRSKKQLSLDPWLEGSGSEFDA